MKINITVIMHPWGHFLCCDFLDTHEVCILALSMVAFFFMSVQLLRKFLWSIPSPLINAYELLESGSWR